MKDLRTPNKPISFQEQQHAKWNTPPEAIANVVKMATKVEPVGFERIIAGEANEVYDVTTINGNVIVRISRSDDIPFERERWAITKSKAQGVPVPEILLVHREQINNENLAFCVDQKIAGTPLSSLLGTIDQAILEPISREAGKILSKIHRVQTNGFGDLDAEGKGEFTSLDEYIMQPTREQDQLLRIAKKHQKPESLITRPVQILLGNRMLFDGPGLLLHNDYSPKHILVENGRINGIIDFETCRGGDPVLDLARWTYYYGDNEMFSWLKSGYENKEIFDDNFAKKMIAYRIFKALSLVSYYDWIGGDSMQDFHWKKLEEDTALFEQTYA
ncbi:MAG: aminoglycoside phosphotransferase family protein [Candidatus Levybacteria bacterium]|nr:aminoglycoside phosphotransferase family protein [Candidatus Levybacteria bacterium]